MEGIIGGIVVTSCIFGGCALLAYLDSKRVDKEQDTRQLIRDVNKSFDRKEEWRSLRMFDAVSAGMTIEFVNVTKNKLILKTPEGLVEAKVNQDNLPHFLLEIKMSSQRIYNYSDVFINLNMNNQMVIIDKISYA